MRMAALSKSTGVPVPTIKFYLREGLLPAGRRTSPNQSQYDDSHIRRLELIRSLSEVGGLSLATIASILTAMDDETMPVREVLGTAQHALTRAVHPPEHADLDLGYAVADRLMVDHGWDTVDNAQHREAAAALISMMNRMHLDHTLTALNVYADAASMIAQVDLTGAAGAARRGREWLIETTVASMVFGDALMSVLRRMAQTVVSAEHFGAEPEATAAGRPVPS